MPNYKYILEMTDAVISQELKVVLHIRGHTPNGECPRICKTGSQKINPTTRFLYVNLISDLVLICAVENNPCNTQVCLQWAQKEQ
jgi:hypothetical protein